MLISHILKPQPLSATSQTRALLGAVPKCQLSPCKDLCAITQPGFRPSGWRALHADLLRPEKAELCCCPRWEAGRGGTGAEE